MENNCINTMCTWKFITQVFIHLWKCIQFILHSSWILGCWGFPYLWKFVKCGTFYLWIGIQYLWGKIIMIGKLSDERFKSDTNLQKICKNKIKLKATDVKENNKILKDIVVDGIVKYMKLVDCNFNDLFENILYSGSFYKKLKVSEPDEYDLCLKIDLSRYINRKYIKKEPSESTPTYIKIKILEREFTSNEGFWIDMLNENNYLNQDKFRNWIQSTLHRALNAFAGVSKYNGYLVKHENNIYRIKYRQTGPALTLKIKKLNDRKEIDIDLVPCLVFEKCVLDGFRPHAEEKFITVPKPLKYNFIKDREILWRTGFYNDEKKLLTGQIKPVIRMVKKLRDVHGWTDLKSYFIETVFMHALRDPVFRYYQSRVSRTALFVYMLRQVQSKLEKGEILDYWHKGFNLLGRINSPPVDGIAKELKNVISKIDNIEDDRRILLKIYKPPRARRNDSYDYFTIILFFVLFILVVYKADNYDGNLSS